MIVLVQDLELVPSYFVPVVYNLRGDFPFLFPGFFFFLLFFREGGHITSLPPYAVLSILTIPSLLHPSYPPLPVPFYPISIHPSRPIPSHPYYPTLPSLYPHLRSIRPLPSFLPIPVPAYPN